MASTPSHQPSADRPAASQPDGERAQFSISPLALQQLGAALLTEQQIQDALESETGGQVRGEVSHVGQ